MVLYKVTDANIPYQQISLITLELKKFCDNSLPRPGRASMHLLKQDNNLQELKTTN